MLTVNGEVYETQYNGYKLVATDVVYIARLETKEMILVHADGLVEYFYIGAMVKYVHGTFQLQVSYGIRKVFQCLSKGLYRLVIETIDDCLYVVTEGGQVPSSRIQYKSVDSWGDKDAEWMNYHLEDGSDFMCMKCRKVPEATTRAKRRYQTLRD